MRNTHQIIKSKSIFIVKQCKLLFTFLFTFMLTGIGSALAKMPEIEDPSQGKQKGIMSNLQAYIYDGAVLIGLLVVAAALYAAAKNVLIEYNKIGDDKGSWAKLGLLTVIGVALVIACIWLGTLAVETLAN